MRNTGRERLAEYCRRCRLKQYELADLLGMHFTTLSQVLAGKRRPGLDTALRIERLTGVPVESWSDQMFVDSAEPKPSKRKTARLSKAQTHA